MTIDIKEIQVKNGKFTREIEIDLCRIDESQIKKELEAKDATSA